jgi:uncharacterized phage protein (TIGR01671 family)
MSREIKFRAWDKEDSRMIVHEQELIPLKVCSLGVLRLDPHYANNLWEIMPIDRFHIMQFTGLLDKNGKEIYEGDIGEIRTHSGRIERFTVEWGIHRRKMKSGWTVDIPAFAFMVDGKPTFPIVENYQNGHDLDIITVIGNIYENPDLLTRLASDAATI